MYLNDPNATFDVMYSATENTIYPSIIFGFNEIEKQTNETIEYFSISMNVPSTTDIKIVVQGSKLNFETIITE